VLANLVVQTAAFGSQDERGRRKEFDFVVILIAAFVEAVNPIAAFFQIFQRAIDIGHAHHRQIRERSRRGARDHVGQSGGAPLGNHHGRGSGGVRRANDGAQIVRILDAVEHHVHPARADGRFERRVFFRGAQCHHTLVLWTARGAVQMFACFEADGNFSLAAQVDDLLKTRARRAFDKQDPLERPAGADRLPDGMDSCDGRHYDKGTFMSAHENVPVPPALEIPDKLYFRIGDVARLAGIKPYVLRFWETEFSMLGPKKSGTGHRLYRRKDVELVLEIKRLLYEKRFTIEGARRFLESQGKDLRKDAPKAARAKAETGRGARAAKAAAGVQPALFAEADTTLLETVRKELRELAEMLK